MRAGGCSRGGRGVVGVGSNGKRTRRSVDVRDVANVDSLQGISAAVVIQLSWGSHKNFAGVTHPTGTIGRVSVIEPSVGRTLFAIANELWKISLRSSREKVLRLELRQASRSMGGNKEWHTRLLGRPSR